MGKAGRSDSRKVRWRSWRAELAEEQVEVRTIGEQVKVGATMIGGRAALQDSREDKPRLAPSAAPVLGERGPNLVAVGNLEVGRARVVAVVDEGDQRAAVGQVE